MSAPSLSLIDVRREHRFRSEDLEMMTFESLGQSSEGQRLNAIVQDKSCSGMGIYVKPEHYLCVGLQLNLWDVVIYEGSLGPTGDRSGHEHGPVDHQGALDPRSTSPSVAQFLPQRRSGIKPHLPFLSHGLDLSPFRLGSINPEGPSQLS